MGKWNLHIDVKNKKWKKRLQEYKKGVQRKATSPL